MTTNEKNPRSKKHPFTASVPIAAVVTVLGAVVFDLGSTRANHFWSYSKRQGKPPTRGKEEIQGYTKEELK
jgi:hypothetical protein